MWDRDFLAPVKVSAVTMPRGPWDGPRFGQPRLREPHSPARPGFAELSCTAKVSWGPPGGAAGRPWEGGQPA